MPMKYGSLNQKTQRVNVDHFSMVPRADIPRSTFATEHTHKTTFDGGYLVPVLLEEVLPGDSINGNMTVFARMNTLLFPIMDHLTLESFFFFVPNRLVWQNWTRFMGERGNPSDSISYTIPQVVCPPNGWGIGSLQDHLGLPATGQITGGLTISHSVLPIRAYNRIWDEWFRDENLQNLAPSPINDGPDANTDGVLLRRNKRHDYFTSALPWPVKGGTGVAVPIGGLAPVEGLGINTITGGQPPAGFYQTADNHGTPGTTNYPKWTNNTFTALGVRVDQTTQYPDVWANLDRSTSALLVNSLRLAIQTQRLLERDARGGTRYTEILKAHFGVTPEDSRLQRPEYIGGGKSNVVTQAIPQTSATGGSGTPLAALAAQSTIAGQHHFSYQATEHGLLMGLIHVDAELTYQQGIRRMWTRQTRYDYYWPVFAHLGEQPIRNDEIYVTGIAQQDIATFGYQERWAEYRHRPSQVSGLFRSTSAGAIDMWHCAQKFTALPTLSDTFIQSNPPFARNLAAGSLANGMQFLADCLFHIKNTRAMPMYSVPGNLDRF